MKKVIILLICVAMLGCNNKESIVPSDEKDENNIEKEVVEIKDTPQYVEVSQTFWTTERGLRVREDYSLDSDIVGQLKTNERVESSKRTKDKVEIDGKESYWYQVESKEYNGWVFGGYLTSNFWEVINGKYYKLSNKDYLSWEEKNYDNFPVFDMVFYFEVKNNILEVKIIREYEDGYYLIYDEKKDIEDISKFKLGMIDINVGNGFVKLFLNRPPEASEYKFEMNEIENLEEYIIDNDFIYNEDGNSNYLLKFNSNNEIDVMDIVKKNKYALDQVYPYEGYDVISISIRNENISNLKKILKFKIPTPVINNSSLLSQAIEKGNNEMLYVLLSNGLNPNIYDGYYGEETPLIDAIKRDNIGAINMLFEFGADPNYGMQKKPYLYARESKNSEIIELLIKNGVEEISER